MSWNPKPKYSLKTPLSKIEHHDRLPEGAIELTRIVDPNDGDLLIFVHRGDFLSILETDQEPRYLKNGQVLYTCQQTDFPLGVLPWISNSLNEFRKPPAKGGLHAGAMTSADEDVEGEMLCIQRAMDAGNRQQGYIIMNRSRNDHSDTWKDSYHPQEIVFAENFLFEGGLLDLIEILGNKYLRGEL